MRQLPSRSAQWAAAFLSSMVSLGDDSARHFRQKDALLTRSRVAAGSCNGRRPGPFFGRVPAAEESMRKLTGIAAAVLLGVAAVPAVAQKVGEVGVDWLGNDIVVEAIRDPAVEGVTCHVSF